MTILFPFLIGWTVLLVVAIGLYTCRRRVARQDDETIHVLDSDADKVAQQVVVAKKLDVLDRWVKLASILVVVSGLVLGALYIYAAWVASSGIPME